MDTGKKYKRILMAGFALIFVFAMLFEFGATQVQANTVGREATDFTLKTVDGKSFTLSKAEGKRGVVLVFFATWCPSCMVEVPQIKKLVEYSLDKGVIVLAVNNENIPTMEQFIKDKEINYRILMDDEGTVARDYRVQFIPTIIGIDGAGVVQYRDHSIPKDAKAFVETLVKGIKAEPAAAPAKAEKTPEPGSVAQYEADARKRGLDYKKDGVSFISKETLQKWLAADEKPLVIDVLSPASYKRAHVKGAVNIPLATLEKEAAKLDKNRKIVTYCANFRCHASTEGAKLLAKLGFTDVHDYEGGIKDWKDAGLPLGAVE